MSDGNEGVLHIPQSSSIAGTSPDFSVICRTLVGGGGSYPSAEKQSVYSTAPADWATSSLTRFVNSYMAKVLFNSFMKTYQVTPLRVRVDLAGWVLWRIFVSYLTPIIFIQIVLFQTTQFSVIIDFVHS